MKHCGSEAADAVADDRGPERRGQWPFIACQCASASCGFEIAGSIISLCFPVLAVNSMTLDDRALRIGRDGREYRPGAPTNR
jgi:hypothetical protein